MTVDRKRLMFTPKEKYPTRPEVGQKSSLAAVPRHRHARNTLHCGGLRQRLAHRGRGGAAASKRIRVRMPNWCQALGRVTTLVWYRGDAGLLRMGRFGAGFVGSLGG